MAAGVEEEFQIVDLATRQLTARAGEVMDQLPAGSFSAELQRSVLEANSRPWTRLTDLAEDLAALRRAAIAAAGPLGLGIVAAGTVPLADPGTVQVTSDPRYEHIREEYQMLAREQLICGTQAASGGTRWPRWLASGTTMDAAQIRPSTVNGTSRAVRPASPCEVTSS